MLVTHVREEELCVSYCVGYMSVCPGTLPSSELGVDEGELACLPELSH